MSTQPTRADAIEPVSSCRNCGANASAEYCPVCGQETRVKLPTARVFLREAAGRYVALDGRTWRTLAALLFRPGFLTREYFRGRRRRYIRPARLFLVLSLALFAAIRIFASAPIIVDDEPPAKSAAEPATKDKGKAMPEPLLKMDKGDADGEIKLPGFEIHVDRDFNFDIPSAGNADLPWSKGVQRELNKRFDHFNALDRQEKAEQVFVGVVRYGPYAMFVLMPAFALLLLVAYAGRGRRYPDRPRRYAEHLVFAAHTHAFLFLLGTLFLAIPFSPLRLVLGCWFILYSFWATKVVYRGGWLGLLLRAFMVGIAYLVLFACVLAGLLIVAIIVR